MTRNTSLLDEHWERGPVTLKFQIGDVVLAEAKLMLHRRSARWNEHGLGVGDTPEGPRSLQGADGYVVWSQPIAAPLPVLQMRGGTIMYTPRQYRRFSVDLTGSFAEYMARFSGKTRSSLRRKLRKFSELSHGTIHWREYRTPKEIGEFVALARALSTKTYQERLLGAGLPATEEFRASAQVLADQDCVRAYLLFLDGEPISYLYCPVEERVVVYDRLGYDPAHAATSPGTVLQLLALEALFAEQRFLQFDFTEGEGQHKELFATESRLCADVYVISRRWFPSALILLHLAADRTSTALGVVLERLHLRAKIRRLIRSI
jgi:hypothetical protein